VRPALQPEIERNRRVAALTIKDRVVLPIGIGPDFKNAHEQPNRFVIDPRLLVSRQHPALGRHHQTPGLGRPVVDRTGS
jgi:hypothetical protein